MKLVEFGEPEKQPWSQHTLEDIADELNQLIEQEVDRMDRTGSKLYGKGRLNRRFNLVQKGKDLIDEALTI